MIVGETVTVTRKGAITAVRDSLGAFGYAADATVTITGVGIAPFGSTELATTTGDEIVDAVTLYCPTGTIIYPSDRFTIRGVEGYQVEGNGSQWTSPFSLEGKGVVVKVRRTG